MTSQKKEIYVYVFTQQSITAKDASKKELEKSIKDTKMGLLENAVYYGIFDRRGEYTISFSVTPDHGEKHIVRNVTLNIRKND